MIYLYFIEIVFILIAAPSQSSSGGLTNRPLAQTYVITKFAELPNFYEELTSQITDQQYKSKLDDSDKSIICSNIFEFESVIEPDEIREYRKKLQCHNHAIFEELFKEEDKTLFKIKRTYSYDNSSKFRSFRIGQNVWLEKTFACVIENFDKSQFEMYYVSDFDYNVNDAPDRSKLSGRFVFSGNQIFALVEEFSPDEVKTVYLNSGFAMSRSGNKIGNAGSIYAKVLFLAEKPESDPICKLDPGRKFRLCTYICAYFEPTDEDKVVVQEMCVKREFQLGVETYEEWMLTCEIVHNSSFTEKFGVTRSYTDNEVYILKLLDKEPKLLFRVGNVGVVVDEADRRLKD